jgi:hypothetical protein
MPRTKDELIEDLEITLENINFIREELEERKMWEMVGNLRKAFELVLSAQLALNFPPPPPRSRFLRRKT